jgi:hypothetical protein
MNSVIREDVMTKNLRSEVDQNFAAFQTKLPELLGSHQGKYALMHRGEIIEFFDSVGDAARFGMSMYKSADEFSIQLVTAQNVNLGHYSYAVHQLSN